MATGNTGKSLGACAAAVGCAFSLGASAQSTESVQAGLDRALRLPLEIIWLQSEIQADKWRHPSLAHALQGCAKAGTPREGCAVSVRSSWRYTFDASSGVRPAPIVISSLDIPNAPFAAGRLNLSGSGRVYLVTSEAAKGAAIRPPAGVLLLAAGSTVQLVDAAYPSIQIEVKAPPDQPLFLGNLAESDVTKVVALLVRQPGLTSASAADVLESGRVALRVPAPAAGVQLASISSQSAAPFAVASVDLSRLAGSLELPLPLSNAAPEAGLAGDFTLLAGALEKSAPLPAPFAVASANLSTVAGMLEIPVRDAVQRPAPLPAAIEVASVDLSRVAGSLEVPLLDLPAVPVLAEPARAPIQVAAAAPSPVPSDIVRMPAEIELEMAVREIGRVDAEVASVDLSLVAGSLEVPLLDLPAIPAQAEPARAPVRVATAAPSPAPADIVRMRAEIEAEIARERERMAQALQGRGTTRFRFGT